MKKILAIASVLFFAGMFVYQSSVFAEDRKPVVDEGCGSTQPIKPKSFELRFLTSVVDIDGNRVGYYFEIISKGKGNFKIKPMMVKEIASTGAVLRYHLRGCIRNQPTRQAAMEALRSKGFNLFQTGGEEIDDATNTSGNTETSVVYGRIEKPLPDFVFGD